jgi:hypothetical protein
MSPEKRADEEAIETAPSDLEPWKLLRPEERADEEAIETSGSTSG